MKLMNREPTEEMVKAGREFQGIEGYTACEIRNIYRDMYDAAPEINAVSAWLSIKAENERLRNEVEELKQDAKSCTSCSHV